MDGGARQQHGLDFEAWIKKTFFSSYTQTGVTDKWDATGVIFKPEYALFTHGFSGKPVSIKTCKYGTSINLGDAIRQFENDEDFLFIVGFWRPWGIYKKFLVVKAVSVDAKIWHSFFEKEVILLDDDADEHDGISKSEEKPESWTGSKIRKLDALIKDKTIHYEEVRKKARLEKKEITGNRITLNPKIDSKGQRRLQCSLPFEIFWRDLAREGARKSEDCTFWGKRVPTFE